MKSTTPIQILLADDHEIFRDGFKVMIKKQPQIRLVGEAGDGKQLIELTHRLKPDVIVTDIKMPGMDGLEATRYLTKLFPNIGIIALSMYDEETQIIDMLEAGAKGYLLKNAHKDEILEAIQTVHKQETYYCNETSTKLAMMIAKSRFSTASKYKKLDFSEKEYAVIRYICQEMSNKEIAQQMNLSTRTIEGYRDKIQEKIGAKNSAGIVVYAIRNHIYKVD
ncbi:MAG TPA: response regulator transcription factor [Flavitalea sp.]|nr:response regulator transcription factor [Flavitalea sp.]